MIAFVDTTIQRFKNTLTFAAVDQFSGNMFIKLKVDNDVVYYDEFNVYDVNARVAVFLKELQKIDEDFLYHVDEHFKLIGLKIA